MFVVEVTERNIENAADWRRTTLDIDMPTRMPVASKVETGLAYSASEKVKSWTAAMFDRSL